MTVEDIAKNLTNIPVIEKILFSWFDYTLFGLVLGISAAIGIYFGFFSKQDNVIEYILGGKTMKIFPISMSLVASEVSAVAFLAVPADVYLHGASFWFSLVAIAVTGYIAYKVYFPVYYKLQLTTCFEYLKLRFDEKNSTLALFMVTFPLMFDLPILIYGPALAFSQVSDIPIHWITPSICLICIFYTTIGGLKAVVWTDTFQFSLMCLSVLLVFVLGVSSTGGLQHIFEKSYEGGRLYLWDLDPDPTNRTSIWSVLIGNIFAWSAWVVASQVCSQKFQSLPTYSAVKWSLIIYVTGLFILKSICIITGLIMYVRYFNCDPITTQVISNSDQLVPYYVMDVTGKYFGLPGLFIAGIFCAALSTMSTDLNALTGIIYEDFIKNFMPEGTTEKTGSNIMKLMVVIMGLFSIGMVYVIAKLGSLFSLAVSIANASSGPLLGMFTLGMLVPFANSKGTLIGSVSGLLFMGWIVCGAQYHIYQGGIMTPDLPTSMEGCMDIYNITAPYPDGKN